jgi:glycosyltransferase involved in cell wall biosynthesis
VDTETELLVDPASVEEVADAIVRIGRDPALAKPLGDAGRRRVYHSHRYEDIAARIFEGIVCGGREHL